MAINIHPLVFLLLIVNPINLTAQKKVVPVKQVDALTIQLPAGSVKDNRLLMTASAATLLNTEAKQFNTALNTAGVYTLPGSGLSKFNNDSLELQLKRAGWPFRRLETDNHFYLITKNDKSFLLYFQAGKKTTDLYVAAFNNTVPLNNNTTKSNETIVQQSPSASPTESNSLPTSSVSNTNIPAELTGTWLKSGTVNYNYYQQAVELKSGYTTDQYAFNKDGTYSFHSKSVLYADTKILLVREKGTYNVNGNQLTIQPKSCVMEEWSKKNNTDQFGSLRKTVQRKIETVTYTFTRHYFSGIQEWNLVLQASKPTERDGPFSGNITFNNAWYFRRPSNTNVPLDIPNK